MVFVEVKQNYLNQSNMNLPVCFFLNTIMQTKFFLNIRNWVKNLTKFPTTYIRNFVCKVQVEWA